MKKMALHWKIIIGLVLGVIWAFIAVSTGSSLTQFTQDWISPWGTIFIRSLKFIAVPLVLFSIINGITSLTSLDGLGRLGLKTISFYVVTTVLAVTTGLIFVNVFKPGNILSEQERLNNRMSYESWVADTPGVELVDGKSMSAEFDMKNMPMKSSDMDMSMVSGKIDEAKKQKEAGPLQFVVDMVPENLMFSLSNNKLMLQVIFFAILFGVCTAMLPTSTTEPVVKFISSINEVFLKMVDVIMQASPFFVFALMSGVMSKMASTTDELLSIFQGLAGYSLTVVGGLFFMIFIFYPILLKVVVRKIGYGQFFKRISPAQFLAFSTSSSAATLPVTMECVEDNLGVSKRITSFVLPIGATVNMDGTSLYQAVAVIFLAQMHMIDLSIAQQLTIVLTATLASIGSAAVPSAGLVMLAIVLQSVQLNPMWIAIIFPIDRLLDMCRTVVNVTGDATVSSIIAHSEDELEYKK